MRSEQMIQQLCRVGSVSKRSRAICLPLKHVRSFATETHLPSGYGSSTIPAWQSTRSTPIQKWPEKQIMTTVYRFPEMEPLRFEYYPSNHLGLPLRRDLLHRAVIYEADMTRQGTASTKWRKEVHGSGQKIRPQKGSGKARLGDKKSPMLRGGGVAFGPKPRDFSTNLPRKIYDIAWRTALSYRYRQGELIVVEDVFDLEYDHPGYVKQVFARHGWGHANGRSTVIAASYPENLFRALQGAGEDGRVLPQKDVDVKDLLETGRIIIEKQTLDGILREHQSDLVRNIPTAVQ